MAEFERLYHDIDYWYESICLALDILFLIVLTDIPDQLIYKAPVLYAVSSISTSKIIVHI